MSHNMKEAFIFVDKSGIVTRYSKEKKCSSGEYMAVVLILVYLPDEKQIVLFNRAHGAADMQDHWALTAGKMNTTDFVEPLADVIGKKISLQTTRNSAAREFMEELNILAAIDQFEEVVEFTMPEKNIYFSMMAWPINKKQLSEFTPDGYEVDEVRQFSLEEFIGNQFLGDAIVYKKDQIISFLSKRFFMRSEL